MLPCVCSASRITLDGLRRRTAAVALLAALLAAPSAACLLMLPDCHSHTEWLRKNSAFSQTHKIVSDCVVLFMKRRLGAAWNEFASWHRGIPNPPDKADLSWSHVRAAFRQANALYLTHLRAFYGGLFADWRAEAEARRAREAAEVEREAEGAARALADGARATAAQGPAAFRRWIAPRLALFSGALIEFGRGFREGKNAPAPKMDLRGLFKEEKKD
jgi:hypothetical protein